MLPPEAGRRQSNTSRSPAGVVAAAIVKSSASNRSRSFEPTMTKHEPKRKLRSSLCPPHHSSIRACQMPSLTSRRCCQQRSDILCASGARLFREPLKCIPNAASQLPLSMDQRSIIMYAVFCLTFQARTLRVAEHVVCVRQSADVVHIACMKIMCHRVPDMRGPKVAYVAWILSPYSSSKALSAY